MKNILFIAILSIAIFGCTSSDKKTTEDAKDKNEAGVQNANGELPDTTNAINLSTHKKDSTQSKDSVK